MHYRDWLHRKDYQNIQHKINNADDLLSTFLFIFLNTHKHTHTHSHLISASLTFNILVKMRVVWLFAEFVFCFPFPFLCSLWIQTLEEPPWEVCKSMEGGFLHFSVETVCNKSHSEPAVINITYPGSSLCAPLPLKTPGCFFFKFECFGVEKEMEPKLCLCVCTCHWLP